MKESDELKIMLKKVETQLRIYHSVLNMAVTLLEKHAPHTIMVFETVLETIDEMIREIQDKIDVKPKRKKGVSHEKE